VDRSYKAAFAGLNTQQKQAVETIDGPVLVIAGPGTGKTQLVGTRVGYILQKTDTPADAILLLTFTEAGVQAMRERLARLVGKAAYDVQLNTYHAFGGEIFRRYPDYFEGANLSLIEELSSDSLLRSIIAKLPYSNPLKFADNYIGELKNFISEAKRALLSPQDIENIAQSNLKFIRKLNQNARKILDELGTVSKKAVPIFQKIEGHLASAPATELPGPVAALA
jgi:DNA helicase-2/ATP-dependent DNA helicase PcrA